MPSAGRHPPRRVAEGSCQGKGQKSQVSHLSPEEPTQVYGTTLKALIHEMFGDGIMSAIDFELDVQRKEEPKGDRVVITMSGKFLPYKVW